ALKDRDFGKERIENIGSHSYLTRSRAFSRRPERPTAWKMRQTKNAQAGWSYKCPIRVFAAPAKGTNCER
ncbi:MAG: hypothetical protein V4512_03280, partial [Pseudomonadota bacterium]